MAQLIDISIHIQQREIHQFSSLTISQGIFEHHSFRLICPAESIDGPSGGIFNSSKSLIGASVAIRIKDELGKLEFAGLVTQIEAAHSNGYEGDIIISGFSPTILLDSGVHCKSWEKQAVAFIAKDVSQDFISDILKFEINPCWREKLPYMVQYHETAWQFLGRLSAAYGEWFFYDGKKLILGRQGKDIKLTYGQDLHRFNTSVHLSPANYRMVGFDYSNNKVLNGKPGDLAGRAGLNELGRLALQVSEKFYGTSPKHWVNQDLTNQKQLDDFANIKGAMQSSSLVRFNGRSIHPGVQVGGSVSIRRRRVDEHSTMETIGDYSVIAVHHYCDGQKAYSNEFEAVPLSVKLPPVSILPEPPCETQSARVTDNYDESGLGRIRVRFHWMKENEKTPWLRITSPHGGPGKGMFFIPEIGEEVIVGFEGGRAVKPYVIGTVYNGKDNAKGIGNAKNDIKQLKTRSGHTIRFDDVEPGSITISTPGGHTILLNDKDKTISITGIEHLKVDTKESISMTSKKISMKAEEISIEASGNAKIEAGSEMKLKAGSTAYLEGGRVNIN